MDYYIALKNISVQIDSVMYRIFFDDVLSVNNDGNIFNITQKTILPKFINFNDKNYFNDYKFKILPNTYVWNNTKDGSVLCWCNSVTEKYAFISQYPEDKNSYKVELKQLSTCVEYWFISSKGKVQNAIMCKDSKVDAFRVKSDNYFVSKQNATSRLEQIMNSKK